MTCSIFVMSTLGLPDCLSARVWEMCWSMA
jgi:hypothetical protein